MKLDKASSIGFKLPLKNVIIIINNVKRITNTITVVKLNSTAFLFKVKK